MFNRNFEDNTIYKVGIYIRLSQEDTDKKFESDSESVINQRNILKTFVANNNYILEEEYIDEDEEPVEEYKEPEEYSEEEEEAL